MSLLSLLRRPTILHNTPICHLSRLRFLSNVPGFNRNIKKPQIANQKKLPPPPVQPKLPATLDYHLNQVNGKFEKVKVRLRWALIRSHRPFNTDDIGALFSWIIWGHILWIILGTTTFISLVVWFMSKFNLEDFVAKKLGRLVTKETGFKVSFDQAIVPDWKAGCIQLNKVNVQRRPTNDDGNYTQFDLTVDQMLVTLSVKRWLGGQGILKTVEARGVRGVLDRRFLKPSRTDNHRRKAQRGDFDFELVKIDDVLVTLLQANLVPPVQISLFSCELPRLRKQWLLYDFLNCNYLSGSFDNSMFSMHSRQVPNKVSKKRIQRFRIDDVNVRHFNRGVTGMFGWIESGSCDFVADITLPPAEPNLTVMEKTVDLFERYEAQIKNIWSKTKQDSEAMITSVERRQYAREARKMVTIDLRVQFNNPRASAPLYSPDLNYLNNAIIHPVVAYINSRDTYIPVHCSLVKKLSDFDGSWTVYDSGLMGDLSGEIYEAFADNARDEEARSRRIKKVGFWSLQFMAQLVLLTLGIVA